MHVHLLLAAAWATWAAKELLPPFLKKPFPIIGIMVAPKLQAVNSRLDFVLCSTAKAVLLLIIQRQ